ncbi:MAG: LysM domain-containing protein [Anaerolineae bacterium]|nr:LysM domain-containing protein [Anaerolineae bacterium]
MNIVKAGRANIRKILPVIATGATLTLIVLLPLIVYSLGGFNPLSASVGLPDAALVEPRLAPTAAPPPTPEPQAPPAESAPPAAPPQPEQATPTVVEVLPPPTEPPPQPTEVPALPVVPPVFPNDVEPVPVNGQTDDGSGVSGGASAGSSASPGTSRGGGRRIGCGVRVVHVVRPGENLFRIALRYRTTIASIARRNGIADARTIRVGQRLTIVTCR